MPCKIIVLQGIPASGKSTWAREFVKGKKDWVIVSRDDLRNMRGDYWIVQQEDYISSIEAFAVETAIINNLNVIIDATNLNTKTIEKWKNIADSLVCDLEFRFFYVSLYDAIKRDKERENPVGEQVIKTFYYKYIDGK